MNELKKTMIAFALYLSVATVALREFIMSQGVIGLRHDWSIPPFDSQLSERILEPFFLWSSNGYSLERPSLVYYRIFEDMLIFISNNTDFHISKLAVLSLIVLAGITAYSSLRLLKFNFLTSILLGLFYATTPIVFNRIVAGYMLYLFSYALMPLVLALFIKGIRDRSPRKSLICGMIFGLAVSQLQFILLIPLVAAVVGIIFWIRYRNFVILRNLAVLVTVGVAMHSFWIVPVLIESPSMSLEMLSPKGYHETMNAPTVEQSVSLIGYTHQYDYSRILTPENQAFLIIPFLLGLASFGLTMKNQLKKDLRLIGVISLGIGIFLVTATKSPLGDLWSFIYDNVSVMRILRETYHAAALISFGNLLLMATTIDRLTTLSRRRIIPICGVLLVTFVLLAHPLYSGNFAGQLQTFDFPPEYDLEGYELDASGGRVLLLPSFDPVRYETLSRAHVDPMLAYPTGHSFPQSATPDNRIASYRNFLLSDVDDEHFQSELGLASVKYVIIRKNVTSAYFGLVPQSDDGTPFASSSDTAKTVDKRLAKYKENSRIVVHNSESDGFFKVTHGASLVSGNYKSIGPVLELTGMPLVFASDIPGGNEALISNAKTIVIQGNQIDDFIFDNVQTKQLVFMSSQNLLPTQGWTSATQATWWWKKEFLYEPPPYNQIIFNTGESADDTMQQTLTIDKQNSYKIFIRLFENVNGGQMRFLLDGNSFDIHSKNNVNRFVWKEIGIASLDNRDYEIALSNTNGFNAVSAVLFVPIDDYETSKNDFIEAAGDKGLIYVYDASDLFIANTSDDSDNSRSLNESAHVMTVYKEGLYNIRLNGDGRFALHVDDESFNFDLNVIDSSPRSVYLSKGDHSITVTPLPAVNIAVPLPTVYGPDNSLSNGWTMANGTSYQVLATPNATDLHDGDFLEISTPASQRQWSWIRSEPINVVGNAEYRISTRMSYQNTNSSHIKMEGFNSTANQWIQLVPFVARGGTGSSDWNDYTVSVKIPNNISQVRIALNAGWVLDPTKGNATTRFDDFEIYRNEDIPVLDSILLFSELTDTAEFQTAANSISGKEINPTMWTARVSSNKPFLLIFAEGYDPQWEATIYKYGHEVGTAKPIPLYSAINGFQINDTGDLEIVIQYRPQLLYFSIALILAIAFLTILFYFAFMFYKNQLEQGVQKVRLAADG